MNVGNFNANFKAVNSLNENGALRGKERLPVNENPPKFDKQDYIVNTTYKDEKGRVLSQKQEIVKSDELTGQIDYTQWTDGTTETIDNTHKIRK